MPGRNGYAVQGGWANSTMKVNNQTFPADLSITNRSNNTPAEYTAANSITFTGEYEDGGTDEYIAYIIDPNNLQSSSPADNSSDANSNVTGSSDEGYRYGFNGKEKDGDMDGNNYDYGFRIYNPGLGRFLSVDPLQKKFADLTPYQFSGNTPVMAVDLDGKEPKILISNKETGYTKMQVYGDPDTKAIVVKTYEVEMQYTNDKGETTNLGTFNVTRDGWFDLGTDKEGNEILVNRSSDPGNNKSIFIQDNGYNGHDYGNTPSVKMTGIYSPITKQYNKCFFNYGEEDQTLGDVGGEDLIRHNNTAQDCKVHVGGWYTHNQEGDETLGGTYGCYGIVDPSQVFPTEEDALNKDNKGEVKPSNDETKRFGNDYQEGQKLQKKEHNGKGAKTQVDIQKRNYDQLKILNGNSVAGHKDDPDFNVE